MKQHITIKQLYELNDKAGKRLLKWCSKNASGLFGGYVTTKLGMFPILSIGQMIEFLGDNLKCVEEFSTNPTVVLYGGRIFEKKELCDALWEAVKKILEK